MATVVPISPPSNEAATLHLTDGLPFTDMPVETAKSPPSPPQGMRRTTKLALGASALLVAAVIAVAVPVAIVMRKPSPTTPALSADGVAAAYPGDCPPGATYRACITFELAGDNGLCMCPGVGNVVAFSLSIEYAAFPSLLADLPRTLITANGSVPGPPIVCTENDWVEVTVTNHLAVATSIHWHGMQNVGTPFSDGVPGLSQCGIPPNATLTYGFRANQAGTYWYHAHMGLQYSEGLYGPLIIGKSNSSSSPSDVYTYDQDVTLSIMDYYSIETEVLFTEYYATPESGGNEPIPDAILVNGQVSTPARLERESYSLMQYNRHDFSFLSSSFFMGSTPARCPSWWRPPPPSCC